MRIKRNRRIVDMLPSSCNYAIEIDKYYNEGYIFALEGSFQGESIIANKYHLSIPYNFPAYPYCFFRSNCSEIDRENILVYAKEKMEKIAKRTVRENELFYLIVLIKGWIKSFLPIPQKELRDMLKIKQHWAIFGLENVVSNENKLSITISRKRKWYHGTNVGKDILSSLNDLDPNFNKGIVYGDFAKGTYLAYQKEIADDRMEFKSLSSIRNILEGKWVNQSLDLMVSKALHIGDNPNIPHTYVDKIVGNELSYRVKVFTCNCIEWRESLWNGWIYGQRVLDDNGNEYDMVFGPLGEDRIEEIAHGYRAEVISQVRPLIEIKRDFLNELGVKVLSNKEKAYQLCCYNPKSVKEFKVK